MVLGGLVGVPTPLSRYYQGLSSEGAFPRVADLHNSESKKFLNLPDPVNKKMSDLYSEVSDLNFFNCLSKK